MLRFIARRLLQAVPVLFVIGTNETLLMVNAPTGSNALNQAREFQNPIEQTGLIVPKLDGTGKSGIVVAIPNKLGIPTRFVGTCEQLDDFAPFDAREFVANML
jgi:fused signal recognition particle receptor